MTDATRFPGRPTLYKGIQMRSRLEADFARWLDGPGRQQFSFSSWEYEPQCFASEDGQYLPDFELTRTDRKRLYLEIKPQNFPRPDALFVLPQMEIIRQSEPEADLGLIFWTYEAEQLGEWIFTSSQLPVWSILIGFEPLRWPDKPHEAVCIDASVLSGRST